MVTAMWYMVVLANGCVASHNIEFIGTNKYVREHLQ